MELLPDEGDGFIVATIVCVANPFSLSVQSLHHVEIRINKETLEKEVNIFEIEGI